MSLNKSILLLSALVIAISAAGCIPRGLRGLLRPQPTATAVALHQATATPLPLPSPTPIPTIAAITPTAMPTSVPESSGVVKEMTEDEINEYLAGESFNEQGATVDNLSVDIKPDAMHIDGSVRHEATGLAGDISISGTPHVVDGKLYFSIDDVALGPQFSGLVRTIAQSLILEAMRTYSGPDGIPIPVSLPAGLEITAVRLGEGKLVFEGERN
ncbi:MAG: DUF1439 domain-containing protein [Chloroflexi bacterium]|jgi:hypothetical protein|nr:DUF1439 domain-containing protein [Chloroflexota bacterium]